MHTCDEKTLQDGCASIPDLERVCYYFGQLLGPDEFRDEHAYFANKLALVVSRLIGHGVVCGLDVHVVQRPEEPCPTAGKAPTPCWDVVISPGLAVDCNGQLLIVRHEIRRPLGGLLTPHERGSLERATEAVCLYVSLCWSEVASNHCRPVGFDQCASPRQPTPSRARECVELRVSSSPPKHRGCDGCCEGCVEPCVLLSKVHLTFDAKHVPTVDEHPEVRRMFGRHHLTTIEGVTWVHGATYEKSDGERLLHNLGIRFSNRVSVESLRDSAVVELSLHTGGAAGRDAYQPHFVHSEARDLDDTKDYAKELWVWFDGDSLSRGDRVRIALRCDFILDECCRAVDGNNIGGRVPPMQHSDWAEWSDERVDRCFTWITPAHESPSSKCKERGDRSGPWRSGNGTEGGTFESWFDVLDEKKGAAK